MDIDEDQRGTLSLNEIAIAVLDGVDHDVAYFENQILEKTYSHLVQNGEFK